MRRLCSLAALIVGAIVLQAVPIRAQFDYPNDVRLSRDDWEASWIWREGESFANAWVAFRKSFDLDERPVNARAAIAADSKYWLWINGEVVVREGSLKRGPTPTDGYFDQVDLRPYLQAGTNTVAILVWYFGESGYSHLDSGRGGLLFEADIDGRKVVSNSSWKARRHPAFGWSQGPPPNFRLPESNVIFDASLDIPGWTDPDHTDRFWAQAAEFGKPPTPPWNRLFPRPVPLWRDSELRSYLNESAFPAVSTGDTIDAVLPYNAQVTPYLRIEAPAGLTVNMQTDHYRIPSINRIDFVNSVRTEYITTNGVQEFETPGWMHGHKVRYHIPAGVRILKLGYRETGYDTGFVGHFDTDDPFLDELWLKARRTLYVTMRDYFMETAGRERKQASADGSLAILSTLYATDSKSLGLMRKFWAELESWRKPSGAFKSGVPGNWETEQPQPNLLAFGELHLWEYYLLTGDLDTIDHLYADVRDYLLFWNMHPSGLVVHRAGDWDFFDWEDRIDEDVMENALYYLALRGARKMALATGNGADVPLFDQRMAQIEQAFQRDFWRGSYFQSNVAPGTPPDDRGNALAVLAGLATEAQHPDLTRVLRRELHASPYIENYVLAALFELGDASGALDRIRTRYAAMVDSELTTLWEYWDRSIGSLNHEFGTGTLRVLSAYVAGVQPLEAAFDRARVEPMLGDLMKVDASVPTPHGRISVKVERKEVETDDEPALTMDVLIPSGMKAAELGVPKPPGTIQRITLDGETVWTESEGALTTQHARALNETLFHVRYETSAGSRKFEVFLKPIPARFDSIKVFASGQRSAEIQWTSGKELDDASYLVQERINGAWQTMAELSGSGDTSEPSHYAVQLHELTPGRHTFRVRADARGATNFSPEVVLEIPLERSIATSVVYPNPVTRDAIIEIAVDSPQRVRIDVVNSLGRRVATPFDDFLSDREQYRIRVPVDDLPSGAYTLLIVGDAKVARSFIVVR